MKTYWVSRKYKNRALQLINNWHHFKNEEWHLFSIYRQWNNKSYDYYICLLGFKLRLIHYSEKTK